MRPALVVDVGLKLALVAALAFGTLSDLERFDGKAFGARLIAYPAGDARRPGGLVVRVPPPALPVRSGHPLHAPVPDRHARERLRPLRHDRVVGRREPLRQLGAAHRGVRSVPAAAAARRAEHVRALCRLRRGHCGPLGVRRVLRLHPRLARVGHGLHGHVGRPRARADRLHGGGVRDGGFPAPPMIPRCAG